MKALKSVGFCSGDTGVMYGISIECLYVDICRDQGKTCLKVT